MLQNAEFEKSLQIAKQAKKANTLKEASFKFTNGDYGYPEKKEGLLNFFKKTSELNP
jgi:hypothetical protein